jgi:hypothetical protein
MFTPCLRWVLSAVVFFSCAALAPAAGLTYSSPDGHYSFTLPAGWQQLSSSRMSEINQQAFKLTGRRDLKFSAGFYLGKGTKVADIPLPYLLIQDHALNTPSYAEILKGFNQENVSKGAQEVTKKVSAISDASISNLRVDRERHRLSMNLDMQMVNGVKGKGLSVCFLGKKGIAQLNFYSLTYQYPTDVLTFDAAADTFKYEPGYEYNEAEAGKTGFMFDWNRLFSSGTNALGFDWVHVFWAAIAGAVVGLFLILMLRGAFRSRRRAEVELDPWAHWRRN